jgi:hypothetical protein
MKTEFFSLMTLGLLVLLSGCDANGTFALRSKMTGQLATAVASVQEKGHRYTIDIQVSTQGAYNFLRGKRIEHYRSSGDVRHGIYYSKLFTIERWKSKEKIHDLKTYRINHRTKKIVRTYKKWLKNKLVENRTETLDHYGYNDYLTLLHNAMKQHGSASTKRITYTIAGSEETHGKVPVYITQDPRRIQRWGGVRGGTLIQMGIYKGIFKNRKGSMTVLLDPQQHPTKFYLSNLETIKTLYGVKH